MVITRKQQEYLQGKIDGTVDRKSDPHKDSVYRKRIREQVQDKTDLLVWLSINYPEILRDEEFEIQEYGAIRHIVLKKLLTAIKNLYPDSEPILRRTDIIEPDY